MLSAAPGMHGPNLRVRDELPPVIRPDRTERRRLERAEKKRARKAARRAKC